jgi:hypothetical protein
MHLQHLNNRLLPRPAKTTTRMSSRVLICLKQACNSSMTVVLKALNWMKQAGQASSAENEADALKLAQMLDALATLKQCHHVY